jgi:chondroitin 4-sulfotransferase 11
MISHKYKSIFIHIPKTGGTSIKKILSKYDFELMSLHQAQDGSNDDKTGAYIIGTANRLKRGISDEIWNNYFKFTFVRNPYSRALSNYFFLKYNKKICFNKFLKKKFNNIIDVWHFTLPQSRHIYNNKKKLLVDFIGHFENLQEDFNNICDKIGIIPTKLPYLNKSNKINKNKLLNNTNKKTIYNKFKEDFENFNYNYNI